MRVCGQAFGIFRREAEQKQVARNRRPSRCHCRYHLRDRPGPGPRAEARHDILVVAPSARQSGSSEGPIDLGRTPAAAPSIVPVTLVAASIMR
jgi:hypothetical protein